MVHLFHPYSPPNNQINPKLRRFYLNPSPPCHLWIKILQKEEKKRKIRSRSWEDVWISLTHLYRPHCYKRMEMKMNMNMEPEDEIRRCRVVDGSWSRKWVTWGRWMKLERKGRYWQAVCFGMGQVVGIDILMIIKKNLGTILDSHFTIIGPFFFLT